MQQFLVLLKLQLQVKNGYFMTIYAPISLD